MAREIDRLVAEALGWSPDPEAEAPDQMLNPARQPQTVPPYSTDWHHASVLLQEMALSFRGCALEYMRHGPKWPARWRFRLMTTRAAQPGDKIVSYADTPTMVIALAYARHKGIDESRIQEILERFPAWNA